MYRLWVLGGMDPCGKDMLLETTSRGPSGCLLMSGVSGGGSRIKLYGKDGEILSVYWEGYTGLKFSQIPKTVCTMHVPFAEESSTIDLPLTRSTLLHVTTL